MKYLIVVILCFAGFTASAQWWRIGPLKHKRYAALPAAQGLAYNKMPLATVAKPKLKAYQIPNFYELHKTEKFIMKTAQHNMRFRIYTAASYNFSDLAEVYIKQNRLSEAKWYLLQSNLIARRQNDAHHTYTNLVTLAAVKIDMGEVNLARQDLQEARGIANSNGWFKELQAVDGKLQAIKGITSLSPKADLKYAETAMTDVRSK